ncbi:hypothetical protein PENARI_c005G07782 [Penicillium arizonense]|uniref:Uncharacterized protein n=1 Tax=Penicillium arizonense TaxID=1835702 RepID=A0A1F5LP27_PENAI|nr:hypothetical protein PENARI_c005G07782 [Penicillium arizonense]OGE54972.1 hypothetical protein PENARI_c005G07782 [Penicillium arizonense]
MTPPSAFPTRKRGRLRAYTSAKEKQVSNVTQRRNQRQSARAVHRTQQFEALFHHSVTIPQYMNERALTRITRRLIGQAACLVRAPGPLRGVCGEKKAAYFEKETFFMKEFWDEVPPADGRNGPSREKSRDFKGIT